MNSPAAAHTRTLLRIVGSGFGVAVIIGGTIGVGILRMPGVVAAQLQNFWLILAVWILGGLYCLLGSFSIIELATMAPHAGGFYHYARLAFGDFAGFAVGWADWTVKCAASAYIAVTLGEYLILLFPGLPASPYVIGIASLAGLALLQWGGLRTSSRVQEFTSSVKALSFLLLVGASFWFGRGLPVNHELPYGQVTFLSWTWALPLVVAFQAVIVTYDGYYGAIYFAEEDRNPSRNLPRSMIGGILLILAIYLLVNLALLYALPVSEIATSKLPAAAAAERILGSRSSLWIILLAIISIIPLLNALLLMGTRVLFGLSRDGLFLASASDVSQGGTPRVAMAFSALVAICLIASGTFQRLVALASFLVCAISCVTFAAVFALRNRSPGLPRHFRAWGYPYSTGLTLLGATVFLGAAILEDTRNSLVAVGLLAVAFPMYRRLRRPPTG